MPCDLVDEIASNRHFEFFWFPKHDFVETKAQTPTAAEPGAVADPETERIGWSAEILPSVRELKFNEMEYSVPADAGVDCLRATVAISIHEDARRPHAELFADLEPIFVEYEGRPHWGKWHSRKAADLARLYPRFADFAALRDQLDPGGVFLNDALRALVGA